MTETYVSDAQLKVLEALAIYRYLTAQQLITLGVSKNIKSLRTNILNPMTARNRPWIIKKNFGQELPGQGGRIPFVYCLTARGAALVADFWRVPETEVLYPKGGIQFARDVHHRIAVIDCHIAMRKWAEEVDAHVIVSDWYFDKVGSQRATGYQTAATRISIGHSGDWIEPDGIFGVQVGDATMLYVLEVHRFPDTGRIVDQLLKHRYAIEDESVCAKYELDAPHMVLSVHVKDTSYKVVKRKLSTSQNFGQYSDRYAFTMASSFKSKTSNSWSLVDKRAVDPFPI